MHMSAIPVGEMRRCTFCGSRLRAWYLLVGNPELNLYLRLLLGGGVDQNNTVFVYGFLDFWSFLISHIFYFYFCWPEISASQAMIIRFLFGVSTGVSCLS